MDFDWMLRMTFRSWLLFPFPMTKSPLRLYLNRSFICPNSIFNFTFCVLCCSCKTLHFVGLVYDNILIIWTSNPRVFDYSVWSPEIQCTSWPRLTNSLWSCTAVVSSSFLIYVSTIVSNSMESFVGLPDPCLHSIVPRISFLLRLAAMLF